MIVALGLNVSVGHEENRKYDDDYVPAGECETREHVKTGMCKDAG